MLQLFILELEEIQLTIYKPRAYDMLDYKRSVNNDK